MIELQIGQQVRLSFNTPTINGVNFNCKIKWVDVDRIGIIFPQDNKEYIKDLPEGKELEVVVYTNSGIFAFESIVINSPLEQDFVIELPSEKKKIQRREYIRAPINLQLSLKKDNVEFETRTINVGGGGIRFLSPEKLDVNDQWDFSLLLPEGREINGVGRVLYTLLQGMKAASVITFVDISETERNRLIKLCLDEEIKSLKFRKQS